MSAQQAGSIKIALALVVGVAIGVGVFFLAGGDEPLLPEPKLIEEYKPPPGLPPRPFSPPPPLAPRPPSSADLAMPLNRVHPVRTGPTDPLMPRRSEPQVERTDAGLRVRFAPELAPAHAGCRAVGELEVNERVVETARLRFSACKGKIDGCAGSGGNWMLVRTCRAGASESAETCLDAPSHVSYGRFQSSSWIDVSGIIKGPGRYAVSICDAGCARSPSEKYGPCCDPEDCARCFLTPATRCAAYFGNEHSYGHLNWVEYELR